MRQVVTTGNGGVEVLRIQERPDPKPAADEVLIRVRAAGLNFADVLARQGLYPDAPKKPCVMGYEVSGVVEAVGENTPSSWTGKSVLALTHFGGQSSLVTVGADQILELPASLNFEQGAAIPVNYLTAYALVAVMGALQPGESILIHNVGGGVGLAALDIAQRIGAKTYGTASPSKHDFLRDRGLDHAIDYRNQDWLPVLMVLTQERGVELVIDPLGGSHWNKSYQALRSTGRLGMFGASTIAAPGLKGKLGVLKLLWGTPWFHPLGLMNRNRGVFGLNLGHMWHEGAKVLEWMKVILNGVGEGWVRPHVDRSFPFSETRDAHAYLEERRNIGKVVLIPD
jgi:synaptic vesicle membrane protein VAT-1